MENKRLIYFGVRGRAFYTSNSNEFNYAKLNVMYRIINVPIFGDTLYDT